MDLLETNIYDAKGKVLICGTCLPRMQKDGFKKIEKLTFASVNKSPHCTQLHYIKHEIERVMKTPKIDNIIIENNEIYKISDETIKLSKNLIKLEEKIKSIRECSC